MLYRLFLTAVQESKIGLAIGKLRNHAAKEVSELAKELVKKWKTEVDRAKAAGHHAVAKKDVVDGKAARELHAQFRHQRDTNVLILLFSCTEGIDSKLSWNVCACDIRCSIGSTISEIGRCDIQLHGRQDERQVRRADIRCALSGLWCSYVS